MNAIFAALSDPTRREILTRLSQKEALVTELAEPFQMSLPAISKHLKVLEKSGLINRRRVGREHRIQLNAQPMQQAREWLSFYEKFWLKQLDSLAHYVESKEKRRKKDGKSPRGK